MANFRQYFEWKKASILRETQQVCTKLKGLEKQAEKEGEAKYKIIAFCKRAVACLKAAMSLKATIVTWKRKA